MFRLFAHTAIAATAVVIASFAPATAANAETTYTIKSIGVFNYSSVRMTGNVTGFGPIDQAGDVGIFLTDASVDGGPLQSFMFYCFDITRTLFTGFGVQQASNYRYTLNPMTNDTSGTTVITGVFPNTFATGFGNALTADQTERISGLANLGATLYTTGASDLTARMTAIQAAIWSVEYGLTASEWAVPSAAGFYATYMATSFDGASTNGVLVRADRFTNSGQSLVIATAVPEPASWAMMIAGLVLVGGAMRRRQVIATA